MKQAFQDHEFKQKCRDCVTHTIMRFLETNDRVNVLTLTGQKADHESQILDNVPEGKSVAITSYDDKYNGSREAIMRGSSSVMFKSTNVFQNRDMLEEGVPHVEWYDFCAGPHNTIQPMRDTLSFRGLKRGHKNFAYFVTVGIHERRDLPLRPKTWGEYNDLIESKGWYNRDVVLVATGDNARVNRKGRGIPPEVRVISKYKTLKEEVDHVHRKLNASAKTYKLKEAARIVYRSEGQKVMLFVGYVSSNSDFSPIDRDWRIDFTGECGGRTEYRTMAAKQAAEKKKKIKERRFPRPVQRELPLISPVAQSVPPVVKQNDKTVFIPTTPNSDHFDAMQKWIENLTREGKVNRVTILELK